MVNSSSNSLGLGENVEATMIRSLLPVNVFLDHQDIQEADKDDCCSTGVFIPCSYGTQLAN